MFYKRLVQHLEALHVLNTCYCRISFTGLWALVNNAGVAVFAETEWCTVEAYQWVLDVNLLGLIRVTKAFLPLVRRAKGRVVNISSLAGIILYSLH